jgi:hypothetical protein
VLSSSGGSSTSSSTTAQYSVTYPVYNTVTGVNLIRQDNISASTGLTLSTIFIGTDGLVVAAPSSYTMGHRSTSSNTSSLSVQATVTAGGTAQTILAANTARK